MNDQQKRFVDEYLIDYNATQAAIRAGYAPDSARQQASQLLKKKDVAAYFRKREKDIDRELGISATFIKKRFKEISDRCMTAEEVYIFDGENWVKSGVFKFDSSGANKATEALGKMMGVFEKDNAQLKPTATNVINLGSGVKPPDEATD